MDYEPIPCEMGLVRTATENEGLRSQLFPELFTQPEMREMCEFLIANDWKFGWNDLHYAKEMSEDARLAVHVWSAIPPIEEKSIPAVMAQQRNWWARKKLNDLHKQIAATWTDELKDRPETKAEREKLQTMADKLSMDLANSAGKGVAIGRSASDFLENLFSSKDPGCVKTGFSPLDGDKGGLRRGNMHLWCAPTGHGKSTTMSCLAMDMARLGSKVCFWSGEMSVKDILARMCSRHGRKTEELPDTRSSAFLHHGDDADMQERQKKAHESLWREIRKAGGHLEIWTSAEPPTMMELMGRAFKEKADVLFIDYLSLLAGIGDEKYQWALMGEAVANGQHFCQRTGLVAVVGAQWSIKDGRTRYSEAPMEHVPYCYYYVLPRKQQIAPKATHADQKENADAGFLVDRRDGAGDRNIYHEDDGTVTAVVKSAKSRDERPIEMPIRLDFAYSHMELNGVGTAEAVDSMDEMSRYAGKSLSKDKPAKKEKPDWENSPNEGMCRYLKKSLDRKKHYAWEAIWDSLEKEFLQRTKEETAECLKWLGWEDTGRKTYENKRCNGWFHVGTTEKDGVETVETSV